MTRPLAELDVEAKANVLSRLDAALYWWIEEERFLLDDGRETEAQGAHRYVVWVDRARKAEALPEHPHHTPIPGCPRCEP
jgi:hypothetical protein